MNNLKKSILSLTLAGSFLVGVGATTNAQDWRRERWEERRADQIERRLERQELNRIRQLDRQRRLRYQNYNGNRMVGYYDRFGGFHPVGYYDRFGRFWRYQ